ncbi:MAG TPA: hypothetical protein VIK33_14115 [Anaerolineae bacterium]
MSFQPDADDTPVDLTAGGSSRGPSRPVWSDLANRPRLILLGIIAVLLVIVLVLLASRGGPAPVEVTPTAEDLAARPLSISISGAEFTITPVTASEGRWRIASAGADSAEWIYGTVINYVIGLYPTDANTQLIEGLADNAPITLKMSNGMDLHFRMSGRQRVPADGVAVLFQQSRPGITLVVLGEGGEERLVVTGLYDADQEPIDIGPVGLVPIGSPAQIGEWRVTVLSGQLAPDPGDPTQAFYYVTFNVEYLGNDPISADTFDVKLIDGVRVQYIIDREVSRKGPYGPPGGLVAPRNPTSFTAGYRVSANVPGPSLVWEFKPSPDAPQPARFEVPIVKSTPTPQPNTLLTVVNCCVAVLGPDQTLLVLSGGIGNPTDQQVTISQIDVSLKTPDNVFSDLRVADPPFPWVIPPGQNQAFRLEFTRPPGVTAVLRIVTLQFELSGLR